MNFIRSFENLSIHDVAVVGGKNASLGEMIQNLGPKGVLIPSGFAITAEAYRYHLEHNKLVEPIKNLLSTINKNKLDDFAIIAHDIRTLIRNAPIPTDLSTEITQAYHAMEQRYGHGCDVAVRSSATAEDLPEASFAGQQETYLNVRGDAELLSSCARCFASLFTNRAISYRIDHNFDHLSVALSIGVQKMVRSDKASAGVIFTLDTESGHKDVIFITASYGLGENIVQGTVNPDEFYVHKPTLKAGFKPILKKRLGNKILKLIYMQEGTATTKNVAVSERDRRRFALTDIEILELARQALVIEEHYSAIKKIWCPMDIEWAKDGNDGKLYIVQARPETVHSQKQHTALLEEYIPSKDPLLKKQVICYGKSVGRKIATGKARLIASAKMLSQLQPGEILITDMTDPDWEPIMKTAAGIVTNRGGRTCHAAIVSRELGIPAIVGATGATEKIRTGQSITIDCSSGEIGIVYDGTIPFEVKKIPLTTIKKPPVDIMINLGNPDEAFSLSRLPVSGVGLARLEFIINNTVQIHPMALVHPERVLYPEDRAKIDNLVGDYEDKKQFFVDKLAQEAGTIAAAFYPRPVIIRMSDFKSNEYRKLIAGTFFEPTEENPMIGFRGASRYFHENYRAAFELECRAMKKIREEMGLTNVILMIPFVRTVAEAKAVIQGMRTYGLTQGEKDLSIYMMCEVPSNVILVDEFSKIFDGFSIGSNDLTQLTLAVDRDSALVADIFNERDEAVKAMLATAIAGAHRNKKKIGICGQAPSDYPEVAEFLVARGIDSMSLNPDAVLKEILLLGK
ncbi:MAG: phosphoenolpyruvate synthase [Candidatus Babeliales bacterium]|jgi:pyruvate,water dikinase